ncbi:MAG: family 20 glycosylhydrolase [Bacteroides sp.]|nr:family 20 glycosylhydrolase [Bacteroides sp.]
MITKTMIAALVAAASAASAGAAIDVKWQNQTNRLNSEGSPEYVQRFIVSGDLSRLHRLAFNQFDKKMQAVNPADTVVRIIPGYYYIESPRFSSANDSVVVDIITSGTLNIYSFGPDGVHGVDRDGKPFEVNFSRLRATDRPEQYALAGRDRMPYADTFYAINEQLVTDARPGAYDILPTFKSVVLAEGTYDGSGKVTDKIISHSNPEFYRIVVTPSEIRIEGASAGAVRTARRTLGRLLDVNGGKLPAATVEDWPDYPYRGMMIDVARNYQTLDQMKKFVERMADYRLNRLQFHFIDDEAWRLEIPGLPELTEVGSRRGYTLDETDFLAQIYDGDGNPDGGNRFGSGHYTRDEFIDFLRFCDSLGVQVIPEIETPGHARAAVKAMEARYHKTGDASYRLREDGDTSVYHSAQDFSDNVINPALPGPYKFMDKVFDEVIAMYSEAGVPLEMIHIGGDEVPHGAWSGSPSAQKFMKEHGLETESDLHAYWVKSLADNLNRRGLKLSGWQEIALGKDEEFARSVAPQVGYINLWITWPDKDGKLPAVTAQELGIPVLISTAHGYYFDQSYSTHPDERGLWWAKVTDEFNSLDAYPSRIAPHVEGGNVIGVQGQLWSETVRGGDWMEHYLFPKMFGMVERAWNGDSTLTHQTYNRIIDTHEFPYLDRKGVNYHMRQPGIKADGNHALMNSPYPAAEIRYTLDGTEPSPGSALYEGAVAIPEGTREIRARLYYRGKESVTSILPLK